MAFRYFNPNPLGLHTIDCPVRAICAVSGLDWDTVHDHLCDLSGQMATMPNLDAVWWAMLRQLGFDRYEMIDQCPDCYTIANFAEDHPHGAYVLGPHEHAVAVIDGDWWDVWDSGDTVPTYYFWRNE